MLLAGLGLKQLPSMSMREVTTVMSSLVKLRAPLNKSYYISLMVHALKHFDSPSTTPQVRSIFILILFLPLSGLIVDLSSRSALVTASNSFAYSGPMVDCFFTTISSHLPSAHPRSMHVYIFKHLSLPQQLLTQRSILFFKSCSIDSVCVKIVPSNCTVLHAFKQHAHTSLAHCQQCTLAPACWQGARVTQSCQMG